MNNSAIRFFGALELVSITFSLFDYLREHHPIKMTPQFQALSKLKDQFHDNLAKENQWLYDNMTAEESQKYTTILETAGDELLFGLYQHITILIQSEVNHESSTDAIYTTYLHTFSHLLTLVMPILSQHESKEYTSEVIKQIPIITEMLSESLSKSEKRNLSTIQTEQIVSLYLSVLGRLSADL